MGKSARKSFLGSFKPAIAGLAAAYRSQFNMRFHVAVTVLVLAASFYFQLAPLEWCVILFCIGSVIVAELLNTSLEVTVDIASPQIAGLAKDIAAAAVLIAAIMSVIIGLIIFIPRILPLVNSWM